MLCNRMATVRSVRGKLAPNRGRLARDVSLGDVREEAASLRRAVRAGRDPVHERRSAKRSSLTFEDAAEKVHAARKGHWRNGKHAEQWLSALRTHCFPTIGKTPVGEVQAADVLKVLTPIWLKKPETARRVRQRIGVTALR